MWKIFFLFLNWRRNFHYVVSRIQSKPKWCYHFRIVFFLFHQKIILIKFSLKSTRWNSTCSSVSRMTSSRCLLCFASIRERSNYKWNFKRMPPVRVVFSSSLYFKTDEFSYADWLLFLSRRTVNNLWKPWNFTSHGASVLLRLYTRRGLLRHI